MIAFTSETTAKRYYQAAPPRHSKTKSGRCSFERLKNTWFDYTEQDVLPHRFAATVADCESFCCRSSRCKSYSMYVDMGRKHNCYLRESNPYTTPKQSTGHWPTPVHSGFITSRGGS